MPEGPWLEWHYQRFTLPPGARELARSSVGVQAFGSLFLKRHWHLSVGERADVYLAVGFAAFLGAKDAASSTTPRTASDGPAPNAPQSAVIPTPPARPMASPAARPATSPCREAGRETAPV